MARKGVPSLFVTVTMNPWRDEMERLGLDTTNWSAFSPMDHKSRVFDRPDLVARIYNQFIHAVMTQITIKAEEYFVNHKCVAYAAELEFQARNTPHHHIFLWLDCGLLEDPDEIDQIICAELPRPGQDDELRELVKKLNTHRHSPYCMRDGLCRFGYNAEQLVPEIYLDPTMNKVVYRRREQEDLRVVPYNPRLTREFKAQINVERTNGGGAVAYLMKYTFKPPKPTPVQMNTEQEKNAQQPQQGNNIVRNDIRTYMRARRIGATEACWRLLEFRNVSISPSVEAYSVHLPGLRMHSIHNPNVSRGPVATQSSPLERYLLRPVQYGKNDFLTYMETFKLRKTLPKSLRADEANIPRHTGVPPYFLTKRSEKHPVVGIQYVSPSNVERFALRLTAEGKLNMIF